jgi:hypothetical protein
MCTFAARPNLTEEQLDVLVTGGKAIVEMHTLQVSRVPCAQSKGMASWALRSYAQLWLYRSTELASGVCGEWNTNRLLNAAVILRSLIETLAAFRAILEQAETFLTKRDLKSLHERILKAMFGVRQGKDAHPELPDAVNVLTLIDRLEKSFPKVRWYYDSLCESVHPNADGMNLFGELNEGELTLELHRDHLHEPSAVTSLLAGIRMMEAVPVLHRVAQDEICPRIEELEVLHGPDPSNWPSQ